MGRNSKASIGYGFELPKSLTEDNVDQLIEDQDDFDFMFFGDNEDFLQVYLIIEKSEQKIFGGCGQKLNFDKLKIDPIWDVKLKDFAKANKINDLQIDWWFGCSYS